MISATQRIQTWTSCVVDSRGSSSNSSPISKLDGDPFCISLAAVQLLLTQRGICTPQ